jgi:hypothetical protein
LKGKKEGRKTAEGGAGEEGGGNERGGRRMRKIKKGRIYYVLFNDAVSS